MAANPEDRFAKCIKIILHHCVGSEPDVIREIVLELHDSDAISKNQRRKIHRDVNDGFVKVAIDSTVDALVQHNSDLWKSKTLLAWGDPDLPLECNLKALLEHFLTNASLPDGIFHLVCRLESVAENWEKICDICKSVWPEQTINTSEVIGVCQLIWKCSVQFETPEVTKLLEEVKSVIGEPPQNVSKAAVDNESPMEVDKAAGDNVALQESARSESPPKKRKMSSGTASSNQPKEMKETPPTSDITKDMKEMRLLQKAGESKDTNANEIHRVVDVLHGKSDAKGEKTKAGKAAGDAGSKEEKTKAKAAGDAGPKEEKSTVRNLPKIKTSEELKNLRSDDSFEDIEFRAVIASGQVLRPNFHLYICTDAFLNWGALKMEVNESKGYYYCVIPIPKHRKQFSYKYCARSDDAVMWENFYYCGSYSSNRMVYDRAHSPGLRHDIVSFNNDYGSRRWDDLCLDSIGRHLPSPSDIVLQCEENEAVKCSFGNEIFCWIHTAKNGWKLTNAFYSMPVRPSSLALEETLLAWLRKNSKASQEGSTRNIIKRIIGALALAMAMDHEKWSIRADDLLRGIFQSLSVHELNEEGQKQLYIEIVHQLESYKEKSTTGILDSFLSLFKQVSDIPMADWILALPLYWLIADEGEIGRDSFKTKNAQGLLISKRSSLPSQTGLKWADIRRRCHQDKYQEEFTGLAHVLNEIYQVHPWIAGTFQCFLTQRILIHVIKNCDKYKIADGFLVDSVFHHLLRGCLGPASRIDISDVAMLSGFFTSKLQTLKEAAESEMSDEKVTEESLDTPLNILEIFGLLFSDVAKTTTEYRQKEKENKEVFWCLRMVSLAAQLAKSIVKKDDCLEKVNDYLEKILSCIKTRIHKGKIDDEQLQFWNSIMTMEWHNENFSQRWQKLIRDEIKQKIENTWHRSDENFLDYYASKLDKISLAEPVEACFSEKAFKCTEDLLGKHDIGRSEATWGSALRSIFSKIRTPRFVRIFDRLFTKELLKAKTELPERETPDVKALHFLFNWPFAPRFFRLFYSEDALSKFGGETQEKIRKVFESFQTTAASLQSGAIQLKLLKLILSNKKKFFELCDSLQPLQGTTGSKQSTYLAHILDHCKGRLDAFDVAKTHVQGFLQACAKLDEGSEVHVNTTELKNKLKVNFDERLLREVSPDTQNATGPRTTSFFCLPVKTLREFELINFLKDSKVFHEMWSQTALETKNQSEDAQLDLGDTGLWHAPWKEAISDIWQTAKQDLLAVIQEIDSGTIMLSEVNEWFQRCKGETAEISGEIKVLYDYYEMATKREEPKEPDQPKEPNRIQTVKDGKKHQHRVHRDLHTSSDDDMNSDQSSDSDSQPASDDDEHSMDEDENDTDDTQSETELQDCSPLENLDVRTRQMCNYFQLEKAKETIDLLLQIKQILKLDGDFSSIEKQKARADNKSDTPVANLPDDQTVPSVCKITHEKVEALRLFSSELDLISWLKEKMKDISEVKVMCDLAMISAGETPYEVDIVSCFLSAVMGFSPLIFELNEKAGLDDLLEKCEVTWKNLDADPKLQEKWKDTGRQLRWFQGIENFHGSVEKQSLTLAQEINERGMYTIHKSAQDITPNAANCIELTLVPKDVGKGKRPRETKTQRLRLNELCDLQSKLMLIAGEAEKGQKDVARFVEVLSAVQVLAETFVKLLSAGCLLFSNWSAIITCGRCHTSTSENSENLLIQVRFSDDAQALTGQGSIKDLSELSLVLNNALDRWNDYVGKKRLEYYFLNEYNIQQVTYLCEKLAAVEHETRIPDQVYALLSNVVKDPHPEHIQLSLEEATKIRDEDRDQEMANEDDMQAEDNAGEEISEIELKKRAVRSLMTRDALEEELAKAAVQAEGYADIEDCLNWALLNQFDEESIKDLCDKFDEEAGFQHQEQEIQVLTSVLHNRSQNTLKDVIERLQQKFRADAAGSRSLIDSVNTICAGYLDETMVITLKDSLSIEHFGIFLENLYERSAKPVVHRELMPPLNGGKPNLLICMEHEVLNTALSLFMHNQEEPLPTVTEVLVCDEHTSSGDVERFMRRAMLKSKVKGRLLFVLAFADKLSFNVATSTEKIFNVLSQDSRIDHEFQLVILLSKQQHYLTTCFDKYLVEGKWIKTTAEISTYLKKHLKVDRDGLRNSAACVDKGHSMVKVVSSTRSGVGKSLHVKRLSEHLRATMEPLLVDWHLSTIRLLESTLNLDYVIERLHRVRHSNTIMLVHLDLTPAVLEGIETFAFNMLVLGSIQDARGTVWKRLPQHLYVVEMTDCGYQGKSRFSNRHILNLLPNIKCYAPREILSKSFASDGGEWLGMDESEFRSAVFQRPYQYLKLFDENKNLDAFRYQAPAGTTDDCIRVLLRHCCMSNPSWAQLRHFAGFLNYQLQNCENSIYCDQALAGQELPGLKHFAVKFMIRMSQDFATPSLNISDESAMDHSGADEDGLEQFQFRRRWEESSHPYLFFNEDRTTMSFINVNISDTGDLLDKNGEVKEAGVISQQLVNGLKLQKASLDLNFDIFSRDQKLGILCQVMGIQRVFDPDPTYELTTDNILKILAIYMRLRCRIPVIIMGETGCGKTRMIEFMSRLKAGPQRGTVAGGGRGVENMITLKIHGGVKVSDIHRSVGKAQNIARENENQLPGSTILFYDEANTTEAIYAIKEVMCDLTIDGTSFKESQLQIVAACNPYKQLSKEAIQKLEDSGLGYRIRTSDTTHFFGNIPVRTLVYRVVALPPSMQPFVWDFGQLGDAAESIYIQQMTKNLARRLNLNRDTVSLVNTVLSEAQKYMRSRTDECRYVSLRDVERCVLTFEWFHKHREDIYPLIEKEMKQRYDRMQRDLPEHTDTIRSLLQTIGVCYHASLDDRRPFRERISYAFGLEGVHVSGLDIKEELAAAQAVFLKNMKMDDNVARNEALQENVFMMTLCADMRIPLFLIGKPGSSKSLAKTIVADNMQGGTSRSHLYKKLKQVHILSYQCSALTDAAGIESVFKQCAQLQVQQDLNTYSAVVVLDEIGLAEDSPNMPLKVLHPLLESGNTENSSLTDYDATKKVGFIGISNWALDPAKMNRGIFVTRNKPNKDDLKKTAKGIFENQKSKINENLELLEKLTDTYLDIYEKQDVEYFGLRDYYSLIKMIHSFVTSSRDASVTFRVVANAILRNFSGGKTPHFETFRSNLSTVFLDALTTTVPIRQMIADNLKENESRFLLLLTNEFSAVGLLHLCIENFEDRVQVVFGSSFPGDHNYTDMCRNINRIKVCMETGRTVVLLNMAEIHESLYDALNQHYVTFGGQRYVDLGLGGHRVKCRIADQFRLIVVEQKDIVYQEYPIPLINRLEKHHLGSRGLLSADQKRSVKELSQWAERCSDIRRWGFRSRDMFVGSHDDTVSSVILVTGGEDIELCKRILLESCAMDAVFRLSESQLGGETETIQDVYLHHQFHDSLLLLLSEAIKVADTQMPLLEVASYSNVLSEKDREEIETGLKQVKNSVMLLSLEQFQTEQEYTNKLDEFFKRCCREDFEDKAAVLLIQCSQAQSHGQLVACAKYCLMNKMKDFRNTDHFLKMRVVTALLLSTERENQSKSDKNSLILQHALDNRIVYIDELRPTGRDIAPASQFYKTTLCQVLQMGKEELEHGRGDDSLVNIMTLLKDCVCEAVAKVKSRLSKSERYFERVKMLSKLFTDDDNVSLHFRKLLLQKMVDVYADKEEQDAEIPGSDWIVKEACNRERLQEGGTFRKTLWLCLKRHVARLMAYVISISDRSDNMDLLTASVPWKVEMWLGMFEALPLSWSDIGNAQEFMITSPRHHTTTNLCQVPFSFEIHDFFNILANQVSQNIWEVFFTLFRKSPMHRVIAGASRVAKAANFMKAYTSDLVSTMYVPGSNRPDETQVVEKIIFEMSMKKYTLLRQDEAFSTGDEVALIYLTFEEVRTYLNLISELFKACPEVLDHVGDWIAEQRKQEEFLIHVSVLKSLLSFLEDQATKISTPSLCLEWKKLITTIKHIYNSLYDLVSNQEERDKLLKRWIPLSLLDHLLLQLLPSMTQEGPFEKYLSVVAPHAKLLWRGSVRADVRSTQFLKIISNVLRKCYEDLRLKLLVSWQDVTCRLCQKKAQNPTFLPCGHFTCVGCAGRLLAAAQAGRRCPTCAASVPGDIDLQPASLDPAQVRELEDFKSNCTSFFMEYLKDFCFAEQSNSQVPMDAQLKLVLEELVVQAPKDRNELDRTALDLNLNTRSCILRVLLTFGSELIKSELQNWLETLDGDRLRSMVTTVLMCFEQKLMLDTSTLEENRIAYLDRWEKILGAAWRKLLMMGDDTTKVDMLQTVVEIRCSLRVAAGCIHDIFRGKDLAYDVCAKADSFIQFAIKICKDDVSKNILKEFITKVACHTYGADWFYNMAENHNMNDLTPTILAEAVENAEVDCWSLLGNTYMRAKGCLYKSSEENLTNHITDLLTRGGGQPIDRLGKLLAVMSWVRRKDERFKETVKDALKKSPDSQTIFFTFLSEMDGNLLPALKAADRISELQVYQLMQLITIVAATATCQNNVMAGFYHMMAQPSVVMNMFLPGMPEDPYFSTPLEYRRQGYNMFYRCPNGHLYTIGECRQPMQMARCADCGAQIGGTNHRPAQGNVMQQIMDERSQAGYLLNKPHRGADSAADRISRQGAAAVLFILHSSMLMGLQKEPNAVLPMLGCPNVPTAKQYLVKELLNNLQALSEALARNMDDTVLVMHRILHGILTKREGVNAPDWSNLTNRRNWEIQFREHFLLPIFRNLDNDIMAAQNTVNDAEDQCSLALHKLVHDILPEGDLRGGGMSWEDPIMWTIIDHCSSAHLLQFLGDAAAVGEGVLPIILKSSNLHLVKSLENILRLQGALISKYQNEIDINESETIKLKGFLRDGGHTYEKQVHDYISTWNMVYETLQSRLAHEKRLSEYFQPMTLGSPISAAMPSTRGRGQCAKLLTEYLIDLQNNFLTECKLVLPSSESINELEVSQLSHSHFIRLEKQKDLLPLIHMHTKYTIKVDRQGRRHQITYNVDALEKQAREKFVMCKKQIAKQSVPCIRYPQDIGMGSDWGGVMANTPQMPLTAKIAQDVDRIIARVHSADVCEGVRTLTHAISFLAKVKSVGKAYLSEFLEKDLLLSASRTSVIPKSAQIEHTLSLYLRLSWHKSVSFACRGLNPYKEALSTVQQEEINDETVLLELRDVFEHTDVTLLQQRLNELLVKVPDFSADWSLTDIFPYFDFIDNKNDDDSWYSRLPDEICFKHIAHLFTLTVQFTSQRHV